MVNNVVVFQGVEVTLPPEASFSHRDGVLEVDMSHGFSGKLLLRQGKASLPSLDSPSIHFTLPHGHLRTCLA